MKKNEQKALLRSSDDLIDAVEQYGFLPFFQNEIPGFSVEELCAPELWFADDVVRLRGAENVFTVRFSTRRLAL